MEEFYSALHCKDSEKLSVINSLIHNAHEMGHSSIGVHLVYSLFSTHLMSCPSHIASSSSISYFLLPLYLRHTIHFTEVAKDNEVHTSTFASLL